MGTVVNEKDVEGTIKTTGGWERESKILISEHTVGAKKISMGVNVSQPGNGIPGHSHDSQEEALYCIEGQGKLVMETGEEYEIEPGTAFWNPIGVKHTLYNVGDGPLKVVWAYAPPLDAHLKE